MLLGLYGLLKVAAETEAQKDNLISYDEYAARKKGGNPPAPREHQNRENQVYKSIAGRKGGDVKWTMRQSERNAPVDARIAGRDVSAKLNRTVPVESWLPHGLTYGRAPSRLGKNVKRVHKPSKTQLDPHEGTVRSALGQAANDKMTRARSLGLAAINPVFGGLPPDRKGFEREVFIRQRVAQKVLRPLSNPGFNFISKSDPWK